MKHDGEAEGEAPYSREEVGGPLAGATVLEKVEHKEDVITRKKLA